MNEIVKYDNYMNSLKFTGFTATDFNFFILLCSKMRDKDTTEITIPFEKLRLKTGYTQHPIKQFVSDLKRMNDKLMKITCNLQTKTEIIMFVLFPTFKINLDNQTLTVRVNEEFKFILNDLIKNFTRFDLSEFIKLDSKYSKTLYRLLKQYRTTGKFEVQLSDFREKMNIPMSYSTKYVMDKVIKPSLKELQNYFKDLQCTTKYAHKKGRPVVGYIFSFKPEQSPQPSPSDTQSMATAATSSRPSRPSSTEPQPYQKKGQPKPNQFFQFHQREVSKEELDKLEKQLLQRS